MKTKAFLLPLAFVVFVSAIACQVESAGGSIQCFTTDARSISSSSYELLGSAKFSGDDSYSGDAFFYYSKDDGGKSELIEKGKRVSAGKVSSSNPDFKATLSSLEYGTTYYYVATVQVLGEEYLGAIKSFTTAEKPKLGCSTGEATDITEISATLYGNSTLPRTQLGGATVGFIYSTSSEPTLSNGKSKSSKEFLSDTQFVASITELEPNTKYYFRSYLLQNGNYLYGAVSSFTTASINAKIITNEAQEITEHTATISGNLSLTSIAKLSPTVALYYSDKYSSPEEIKANGTRVTVSLTSDGSFSKTLTNLPHSVTYSYFAYANIQGVEFYGEVVRFSTMDIEATLTTGEATMISEHKATIQGFFKLISKVSSNPTVYFYYSDKVSNKDGLKSSGKRITITSISPEGGFSTELTNLAHSTKYYYVVYTRIEDVDFFGEVRSFSTASINASVSTGAVSGIKYHDAVLSGSSSINTIESLKATKGFYFSATSTSVASLKQNGQRVVAETIDDNYSLSIMGDADHRTYYYVAFLEIEDVEFFGAVKSFKMKEVPNGAIDLGLSVLWGECNIGATNPEDYGGFYEWGRLTEKYYSDAENEYLKRKYSNGDTLDKEDDVAYVKLGSNWRTPTKKEYEELLKNMTYEKTHVGEHNGVRIKSTVPGFTSKSVFFPYAGNMTTTTGHSFLYSYYWTSTFCGSDRSGYAFLLENLSRVETGLWYRRLPIRPIFRY